VGRDLVEQTPIHPALGHLALDLVALAIVILALDGCVATEVSWYTRKDIRPFTAKEAGSVLLLLRNNSSTVLGFGLPVSWVYTAQQYRVIPRTPCTGTD